jgi:hypothetical protein
LDPVPSLVLELRDGFCVCNPVSIRLNTVQAKEILRIVCQDLKIDKVPIPNCDNGDIKLIVRRLVETVIPSAMTL